MKKQLIIKPGFFIKITILSCFLLLTNIVESSAQYIRTEIVTQSPGYDPTYFPFGDVMNWRVEMKVYSDSTCTTPSTFSGNVNFQTLSTYGCEQTMIYTNRSMTVEEFNASYFLVMGYRYTMNTCDFGHVEDVTDEFVYITPGTGYTIIPDWEYIW